MNIIGKLVGALVGVVLFKGWVGLLIGVLLGHLYDRARALTLRLRTPALGRAFIDPLFAFAGALAKSDGRVSEAEIAATEALMTRLGLDAELRRIAIERFNDGKQPGFDADQAIAGLRAWCNGRGDLAIVVLDPLLDLIYAEGPLVEAKLALVRRLCAALGVSDHTFAWLAAIKGYAAAAPGPRGYGPRDQGPRQAPPARPSEIDPYAVLGIERNAGERDIKQAYRKLISQNHPDKLGDVPQELKRRAEQRAGEINAAYERIKAERGLK